MHKYCLACEWAVAAGDGHDDASRLAVEHFVETGHPVASFERSAEYLTPR